MEFVEGETLENLIKRAGRLDVKLALEITTQVAAGLAAVHEQNLVHRDINFAFSVWRYEIKPFSVWQSANGQPN
jgi:serine/threonine protein kinase